MPELQSITWQQRLKNKSPWLLLFGSLLALDQWTKRWVIEHFSYGQVEPVWSFFNLTRLHNTGAAFSFLANAGGWQKPFFITLGIVVSLFILIWLIRLPLRDHKLLSGGLAMIAAGAIGNVIDRVAYGYVVDFLDVFYKTHHWPAFNVADSVILTGVALVFADAIVNGDREEQRPESVE